MGTEPPCNGEILREKGGPLYSIVTLCCKLCKNRWTNQDAVWVVDLGGSKEVCIDGAYMAPPGDTTEPSVCGSNVALHQIALTTCYCYF